MLDLVQPALAVRRLGDGLHDLEAQRAWDLGRDRSWGESETRHGQVVRWRGPGRLPSYPPGLRRAASIWISMTGASQIEVLVLAAAIVVTPLLVAAAYLVRRSRLRRRRRPVSFLEVIRK